MSKQKQYWFISYSSRTNVFNAVPDSTIGNCISEVHPFRWLKKNNKRKGTNIYQADISLVFYKEITEKEYKMFIK